MNFWATRKEIRSYTIEECKEYHKGMIRILFSFLVPLALLSVVGIWEITPAWTQFGLPIGILILWPLIRRTSYAAKQIKDSTP